MTRTKPLPRMASIATLVRLAREGEEGRNWYTHARDRLATVAGVLNTDPHWYAGLLAVLSPRTSVRRNERWAVRFASGGGFAGDCHKSNRIATAHYVQTGEIRGPKTGAFAANLRGDESAVVLDTWMARAFRIDQRQFSRPAVYAEASRRVCEAARILGWTPAQTQAAIWTAVYRSCKGNRVAAPGFNGPIVSAA